MNKLNVSPQVGVDVGRAAGGGAGGRGQDADDEQVPAVTKIFE